jgi:hypothetical protein
MCWSGGWTLATRSRPSLFSLSLDGRLRSEMHQRKPSVYLATQS